METEESESSVTPPLPAEQPVASTGCKVCGAQPQEGFPIPLCSDCRTKLARRPIPIGIKVAGAVVGLLIIFALTRIPASMAASAAFERGLAAEKKGDFATAEKQYQKSVAVFRNSDRVHGRLFVASLKAGDRTVARDQYEFLKGRKIDSSLARDNRTILLVGPILRDRRRRRFTDVSGRDLFVLRLETKCERIRGEWRKPCE